MNAQCMVQAANQMAHVLFGYGKNELRGRNINAIVPPVRHVCNLCHECGCVSSTAVPVGVHQLDSNVMRLRRASTDLAQHTWCCLP